jgi:hypothetical protein
VSQTDEFIAEEGDQCDSCGKLMSEGDRFFGNPSLRVQWRFCSLDCAEVGVTAKSNKARFINAVLGPTKGRT